MKLAALALVSLLALTGCAPNTDAAYKTCYTAMTLGVTDDTSLSEDEAVSKLVAAGEYCLSESKADPAAFNQKWGG